MQSRNITWLQDDTEINGVVINADADLLYQAFLNVAINAFESMDSGGALSVSVNKNDSYVAVVFSDTGHGINEEDMPNIFTPFLPRTKWELDWASPWSTTSLPLTKAKSV